MQNNPLQSPELKSQVDVTTQLYDVIIAGGGLNGLVSSYLLSRKGYSVLLIEKKAYPFHRVCGEYVSNEVIPFLEKKDIFPAHLAPATINRFRLTSISGNEVAYDLDLGGFGISRHAFDYFLYKKARNAGVEFLLNTNVENIEFTNDHFRVSANPEKYFRAKIVIGSFGKRSGLDHRLNRAFIKEKSPYIGVKYHIHYEHPEGEIALHNFPGGYCGISRVENGITNLCYLGKRSFLRQYGNIESMEKAILFQNPHLKKIFSDAVFLFDKPMVINEVSFVTKTTVENHVLMGGDAAGMITPLCGNGMAIAIRSAKILSECVSKFLSGTYSREQMEKKYTIEWNNNFRQRLRAGRQIQNFFGRFNVSDLLISAAKLSPWLGNTLIKQTHGKPFE